MHFLSIGRADCAKPEGRWSKIEIGPIDSCNFIVGDANGFEGLCFHGVKLSRDNSSERKVVLQAVDEGLVGR